MESKSTAAYPTLNEQELHLVQLIRETKYGELVIMVADGKPVRVEEIKKSIKL